MNATTAADLAAHLLDHANRIAGSPAASEVDRELRDLVDLAYEVGMDDVAESLESLTVLWDECAIDATGAALSLRGIAAAL